MWLQSHQCLCGSANQICSDVPLLQSTVIFYGCRKCNRFNRFIAENFSQKVEADRCPDDACKLLHHEVPDKSKTVARGVGMDAEQKECDIRIVWRNKRFGYDREGKISRQISEVGEFYYLQISSSEQRGRYDHLGVCFETFEEAIAEANLLTSQISWFPKGDLRSDLRNLVLGITKSEIQAKCKSRPQTHYFIDLDYEKMIEYGLLWAKHNKIEDLTSDFTNDEIEQKGKSRRGNHRFLWRLR